MGYEKRLKHIREIFGQSQTEMGNLFGVTQNSYCNYEKGNRQIPASKLPALSRFGIDIKWFLDGTINRNYPYGLTCALQALKKTPADIAEKLNQPHLFIEAIVAGEIGPSDEFYDRMLEEGLGVKSERKLFDKVDLETKKLSTSRASSVSEPPPHGYSIVPEASEVSELKTKLDTCFEKYFEERMKNDTLQRNNDALKKELEQIKAGRKK